MSTPAPPISAISTPAGKYMPTTLKGLYYGPNAVVSHLLSLLPREESRAFIITGNSLANKTPVIQFLEQFLKTGDKETGHSHYAGTYSGITQHAPEAEIDTVTHEILELQKVSVVDVLISVGGGSPIDAAKVVLHHVYEANKNASSASSTSPPPPLLHVTIPTTLAAAECTSGAGYTGKDGLKTGIRDPELLNASYILYDASFNLFTPPHLLLSTGFRALDHAAETQYNPGAALVPGRLTALAALQELFTYLPQYHDQATQTVQTYQKEFALASDSKTLLTPTAHVTAEQLQQTTDVIIHLLLAAYASLGLLGTGPAGGLGLSHLMGYALGSPYHIPHGVTSCLTLGHVVKLKASLSESDAHAIAAALSYIPPERRAAVAARADGDEGTSSKVLREAIAVGDSILKLVKDVGLYSTLTDHGVGKDQVDIIATRAVAGKPSASGKEPVLSPEETEKRQELTGKVKKIVENLY